MSTRTTAVADQTCAETLSLCAKDLGIQARGAHRAAAPPPVHSRARVPRRQWLHPHNPLGRRGCIALCACLHGCTLASTRTSCVRVAPAVPRPVSMGIRGLATFAGSPTLCVLTHPLPRRACPHTKHSHLPQARAVDAPCRPTVARLCIIGSIITATADQRAAAVAHRRHRRDGLGVPHCHRVRTACTSSRVKGVVCVWHHSWVRRRNRLHWHCAGEESEWQSGARQLLQPFHRFGCRLIAVMDGEEIGLHASTEASH
jgi:hypothetical protein